MEYTPQNMQAVGQLPLGLLWDGMDFLKQAQGRDQQTLANTMAENQRKQQMHEATLAQTNAQTQGTLLGNKTKQLANTYDEAVNPAKIKNELMRFGVEASEGEFRQVVADINKGMMSQDPTVRKNATMLYEQLPSVMESRKKAAADLAEKEGGWKNARTVAEIGARSREQVAAIRGPSGSGSGQPTDMNSVLAKMKKASEKVAHLTAVIASLPPDDPKAVVYSAQRDALIPQIEMENELAALRARSGLGQDANGQWGVQPTPKLDQKGPTKSKAAEEWITRAMQANPGMTREQIEAEGKRRGKL